MRKELFWVVCLNRTDRLAEYRRLSESPLAVDQKYGRFVMFGMEPDLERWHQLVELSEVTSEKFRDTYPHSVRWSKRLSPIMAELLVRESGAKEEIP